MAEPKGQEDQSLHQQRQDHTHCRQNRLAPPTLANGQGLGLVVQGQQAVVAAADIGRDRTGKALFAAFHPDDSTVQRIEIHAVIQPEIGFPALTALMDADLIFRFLPGLQRQRHILRRAFHNNDHSRRLRRVGAGCYR